MGNHIDLILNVVDKRLRRCGKGRNPLPLPESSSEEKRLNVAELASLFSCEYSITSLVEELSSKEVEDIKTHFALFDQDCDGTITAQEIGHVLRQLNFKMTEAQISRMIREVDKNGNGTIEFPEFLDMMAKEKKYAQNISEEDIIQAFKMFDADGNGFIEPSELKHVMEAIGEAMSEKEINQLMKGADINDDGLIDYKEFAKIIFDAESQKGRGRQK